VCRDVNVNGSGRVTQDTREGFLAGADTLFHEHIKDFLKNVEWVNDDAIGWKCVAQREPTFNKLFPVMHSYSRWFFLTSLARTGPRKLPCD
jgi:hypothetical protein